MRDFRQTKIVCTLGPASSKPEQIEQLAAAGMNIARLNMSHGDHASHLQVLEAVQKLNERLNHPIALLLDLQGPAIRTGDRLAHLSLEVGQEFHVTVGPTANPEEKTIHVDYQDMVQQFKDRDRYKVAKCIQAEPVFCGFGPSAHSKVISVSVLRWVIGSRSTTD